MEARLGADLAWLAIGAPGCRSLISQTGEYALRAVLYLAQHQEGDPVSVETIAEELSMPRNYLSKTLHLLAKRGILASARGPRGGFELAVPSNRLSLLEIVEPFDDLEGRGQCLLGRPECSDQTPCAAHHRWKDLAQRVSTFFRETTVDDLIAEMNGAAAGAAGNGNGSD